jgi:hypothetical protein
MICHRNRALLWPRLLLMDHRLLLKPYTPSRRGEGDLEGGSKQ